jgi:hypothetical protein
VPDGVATVAVVLDNGTPMTAPVSNNFFLVAGENLKSGAHKLTQRWYAADGSLIKTTSHKIERLVLRGSLASA